MSGGIELAPLLTRIKVDTASFKNDMQKAATIGVAEAQKISKSMSNVTKVGDSFVKVGSLLTKGVTVPLAAAAVGTTKMAVDFESSFAKVSTLLDSSQVDFGQYKSDILDASSESKIAVGEFSEAVYQSISAGVDQTKAIGFTTEAMKLAKGGFTDGASAVDILTTSINAYGLEASESQRVSDMLITTQNLGKTTVNELAASMGKVIPSANAYNVNLENVNTSMAILTKNGIATAEATTYYNSMLNELGKAGTEASDVLKDKLGKSFAELQAEGVPLTEILKTLETEAQASGKSLGDMFGSSEAAKAALTIMKDDGVEYNSILKQMEESAGATQEAFEKIDATPAEQLAGALNKMKNQAIELGGEFVPVIGKITDLLEDLTEKFSELSDEEKENILQWAGVAAAAGPVLSVVGSGIKTFSNLTSMIGGASKALGILGKSTAVTTTAIGGTTTAAGATTTVLAGMGTVIAPLIVGIGALSLGMYAFHESNQFASRSINEASDDMSWMERILAELRGQEIRTREELEELGWVHKEFSEDISPEFQEAVEKSTEEVQNFGIYLKTLNFDDAFTAEESAELSSKVESACNSAIQTVQSKKAESQQALNELFTVDDNTLDESEQVVLDFLGRSHDNQVTEIQSIKNDILAIEQTALAEGRALREEEIAQIESHYQRIHQIELEATGSSHEEMLYAKNEFLARLETMDSESASKLLSEKAKIRDEEIVAIKSSYDTQIGLLEEKRAEATAIEKVEIDKQIENLKVARDEKIGVESDLYQSYIDIINQKYPELMGSINQYNGEILTNADLNAQKQLEIMQSQYVGINQIQESGLYTMYNTSTGVYEQLAIKVDEDTNAIIGMHDVMNNRVGAYSVSMGESTKAMSDTQNASYKSVVDHSRMYVDAQGNIYDANHVAVGSMNDLKSATDGTREGIVNINGTPYNIRVDSSGTISKLNEVNTTANNATRARVLNITTNISENIHRIYTDAVSSFRFNGLDNVPYDGYYARLHKNERVLTAEENKVYSEQANNEPKNITVTLNNVLNGKIISQETFPLYDRLAGDKQALIERGV